MAASGALAGHLVAARAALALAQHQLAGGSAVKAAGKRSPPRLLAAAAAALERALSAPAAPASGSGSSKGGDAPPLGSQPLALPVPAPPCVPLAPVGSDWSVVEDLLLLRAVCEFGSNWDIVREVVRGAGLPLPTDILANPLLSAVTPVSTPEAVLLTLIDTAAAAPGMRVGPAAALTPATSRLRPGKTAKQCFDRFRRIIARPLSVSVTLPSNLLVGSPSAPGAAAGGDPEQGALLAGQAAQAALSSALFHTLRRHAELKRRSGSSSGGDGPKAGSAQRGAVLTTAALRQRVEGRLQRALDELRSRGGAVVDDEGEGQQDEGSSLGAGAASAPSKRRRVEAAPEGAGSASAAPASAASSKPVPDAGGKSLRLSHVRAVIAAAVESEAAAAEDEREEAIALAAQATASALGYGGGITVGKDGTASRVVVATLQPLSSASSSTLRRHMGLLAPTGAAGAAYANALATANATGGSHSGALTRFLPLTVGLYRQRPTAAAYSQAAGGVGEMSFAGSGGGSTRAGLPPALFNHSLHASALGSGVAAVTGSARDNLVCHGLLPTLPMRPRPTWRLATGVLQVKSLKLPAHALNPLTLAGLDTSLSHPGAPASATVATLAAAVNAAFGSGVQGATIEAGQVVPRAPSVILPYLHIHRAHSALLPYGGNGGTATAQLTAPPLRPGQPGYVLPAVSHPFALAAGGEPFRRTSPYILALRQRDRERQAMYQQQAQAQAQAAAQAYYQQQAAAQQQQQAAAAQQQAAAAQQQQQQQQQAAGSSGAAGAGAASSAGTGAGASAPGPSAGGDALADILQKVVSNPGLSNLGIPDSELASLVSQLLSEAMIAEINAISTRPGLSQGEVDEAIMHVILRELQGGGGGAGGGGSGGQ
jgi:hypothetical protein